MSEIRVDTISEKTSANGVAIDGVTIKDSVVLTDTISEKTSANGVAVDSLAIKDGKITNLMNATLSAADLGTGLHVKTADSGASVDSNADELVVEGSGSSGISILSGTGNEGAIKWGDSGDNNIGFISYDHAGNDMYIGVNADTRVKVHDNGVAAFNNGVALGVGTANTASNVLDDYEEGTFTPIFISDAAAGAYNIQDGDYTKVGDLVHICINLSMSTIGSFAGAYIQIQGLPFASENVNSSGNILSAFVNGAASTMDDTYFRIANNASHGRLEKSNGSTGTDNSANANHLDTGTTVCVTGTYKAA